MHVKNLNLTNTNKSTAGITSQLSTQITLLGNLLGEATSKNAPPKMLKLVEKLRLLCKQAEEKQSLAILQKVASHLEKLPLADINWLIKVYTVFFNLVNQAEIQEIIRINHEREMQATLNKPRKESIAAAIYQLKQQGYHLDDVLKLLAQIDIGFTLTAHPTEARRQTILQKQRDVNKLLAQLNQPQTEQQKVTLIEQLRQSILLFLYTDSVRSKNLSVADEVRNGLYFLRTTIWQSLPTLYADIKFALKQYYDYDAEELPIMVHYQSWIGGDCDGNPFITPEVIATTLQRHSKAALKTYYQYLLKLRTELSLSNNKIKLDAMFKRSLRKEQEHVKLDISRFAHFEHEPYRLKISYMLSKITAKLEVLKDTATKQQQRIAKNYQAIDLLNDLMLIKNSLKAVGMSLLAQSMHLNNLILQSKTFGFHLAKLDIRQHSGIHEAVITDILRKHKIEKNYQRLNENEKVTLLHKLLKNSRVFANKNIKLGKVSQQTLAVFDIIKNADPNSIGQYVISMTHNLSDVLEVLLLAKISRLWSVVNGRVKTMLDVSPLFETVEDLSCIEQLLTAMYNDPIYKKHLCMRHNIQESMLGYSDSNKDGGYCAANYLLYQAQSTIAEVSQQHSIDFRIFHGRGGSAGRGGGRVYQAILAMPEKSQNGRMRVTEQGEVITFHYALNTFARRHYEQTFYAMLIATAAQYKPLKHTFSPNKKQLRFMQELANASLKQYRQLIQHSDFWQWYINVTPIEFISKMPIASRPVSRKNASEVDFTDLRAIPWVFSWTQTRYNVPGWFGIGRALQTFSAAHTDNLDSLQHLYKKWPFFNLLINNIQQEMARAHFLIAKLYQQFSANAVIVEMISKDFALAEKMILKITEQKALLDNNEVLQKSIQLRNPYTDVLNLAQIELMYRQKKQTSQQKLLNKALLQSINGLSAAMQSTG